MSGAPVFKPDRDTSNSLISSLMAFCVAAPRRADPLFSNHFAGCAVDCATARVAAGTIGHLLILHRAPRGFVKDSAPMSESMAGKVVVITGGNTGIGRAT